MFNKPMNFENDGSNAYEKTPSITKIVARYSGMLSSILVYRLHASEAFGWCAFEDSCVATTSSSPSRISLANTDFDFKSISLRLSWIQNS